MARSFAHLGAHRLVHFPLSGKWAIVQDSNLPASSDGCHGEIADGMPLFDTSGEGAKYLADRGVMVADDGTTFRYKPHNFEPAPLAETVQAETERQRRVQEVAGELRALARKGKGEKILIARGVLTSMAEDLDR
jgi:hypothetical protein